MIIGSIVGGEVLYITRMAHWSDRQMQRFEPRYRDMRENFARMLPHPEEGLLPLRILSIDGNIILGKTPDGQNWEVNLQCSSDECRERQKKATPSRPTLFQGSISGDGTFSATEIRLPPKGMPKNRGRIKPPILPIPEGDHSL